MATNPISSISDVGNRIDSIGLDMQSLLQIILTQLTYQDPLKPVDNFEFVSQLAQFTSLEQTRQITDKIDDLLSVQSATQTLGLLGRNVDVQTDTALLSGIVKSVSFKDSQPQLTIETESGEFLTNANISQIVAVRQTSGS
ncbi:MULTISPECIES: flagellar hook assembly protein FlgD [unclassified Paraburkholderia]|uniref:flagellar hook assembly protein FlgD n=1 Tax=unclassified Paraburkholderia TaxID=2615204 RepID=UPI0016191CF0|nr:MULTISPECIES: flagellar hook capping FlgD N-terminal domain-containing protein [unclassified Paraburkholderia]MBB5447946.1 flagellar basal-body rod modification protein FlgD [Paraburkholderia sp. WSM4177]MBB5488361.1 flagellar basal-body rod modification protein FlgD [Paraburkholderia sp. WSM4180]